MNIFPLFFWTFLSFAQLALCYVHPLEACNTETKKNKTEAICVLWCKKCVTFSIFNLVLHSLCVCVWSWAIHNFFSSIISQNVFQLKGTSCPLCTTYVKFQFQIMSSASVTFSRDLDDSVPMSMQSKQLQITFKYKLGLKCIEECCTADLSIIRSLSCFELIFHGAAKSLISIIVFTWTEMDWSFCWLCSPSLLVCQFQRFSHVLGCFWPSYLKTDLTMPLEPHALIQLCSKTLSQG